MLACTTAWVRYAVHAVYHGCMLQLLAASDAVQTATMSVHAAVALIARYGVPHPG